MESAKTVRQLLQSKGHDVHSLEPRATVYEALRMMADQNVGALLVREGERLVGIFSERDYARKVILRGKSSRETPVEDVMTSDVISVTPDQTLGDCMELMTDKRIRHLPVMEDGRLIGVISIGDVVKAVISEQEFLIEQLQSYITGAR